MRSVPLRSTEEASFRMNVGWGMSQTITVVAAVTVTVETVVVTGGRRTVDIIVIVGTGNTAVEVLFTVVVEGWIERHEQADEISDEWNADI